jgi:5-methylcytosine-specific restriction endonuclease McrA
LRLEFSHATKEAAFSRANGFCEHCKLPLNGERPEYHHITEAWLGGDNSLENALVVHKRCHKLLTKVVSHKRVAKVKRIVKSAAGIKRKYRWPKRSFAT